MAYLFRSSTLAISLMLTSAYCTADSVTFDAITSYSSTNAFSLSSISGIEKDTGNSVTANFSGRRESGDTVASICTSLVITAMEKPGRYYMLVSWIPDNFSTLSSCKLELKSLPE